MKYLLFAALIFAQSQAMAGDYNHHYNHHHHNSSSWVAPAIIAGTLGYMLAPRTVQPVPPVIYAPPPVYSYSYQYQYQYPIGYHYEYQYNYYCNCYNSYLVPN